MTWDKWLWVGMWLPTLLGTFDLIMWLRPEKDDGKTDASNRFNRLRVWWFGHTRRYLFLPVMPSLKYDELDNVK